MSQPPHIQRIVPCRCGSTEVYWHRPSDGISVYECDPCWAQNPANPDRVALDPSTLRPLAPDWMAEAAGDAAEDLKRLAARYPDKFIWKDGKLHPNRKAR